MYLTFTCIKIYIHASKTANTINADAGMSEKKCVKIKKETSTKNWKKNNYMKKLKNKLYTNIVYNILKRFAFS